MKIEDIRRNGSFLTQYLQGMSMLNGTRIFEFLREHIRPNVSGHQSDAVYLASEASRIAGYMEALDDIYYFKEKFIADAPIKITPDYGAAGLLRAENEEFDSAVAAADKFKLALEKRTNGTETGR